MVERVMSKCEKWLLCTTRKDGLSLGKSGQLNLLEMLELASRYHLLQLEYQTRGQIHG